jgi:hypothetical protein
LRQYFLLLLKVRKEEKIAVGDKNGVLKEYLENRINPLKFEFINNADTSLLQKDYTAVLLAPEQWH